MTYTYDNLGPCRHWDLATPAAVMKWHNRALMNDNFVSEWQARAQAEALQHDLASQSPTMTWWCTPSSQGRAPTGHEQVHRLSRPKHPKTLRVGFAEDLELWIGEEDSFKMYKIVVPSDVGASNCTPWSSPAMHESTSSSGRPTFAAHTDATGNFHVHRCDTRPSWAPPILDILNSEGEADDDEERPVIYATSYFINHRNLRFQDQPRVLRFDDNVMEWERDVRLIWEDLVDQSAPLDVVIVRPDPPHNVYGGTSFTVIVHQHPDPTRAAYLITEVHIQDPRTLFHTSAHSTELQLPCERVYQLTGVEDICRQRVQAGVGDCTIHIGPFVQPSAHPIAIFHGLGLQLRIPSLLSASEAEQNLVNRIARQRRHRTPHIWDPFDEDHDPEGHHPSQPSQPHGDDRNAPEDEVSMMARNPVIRRSLPEEPSRSSSSSSTASSSSFVSEDLRRSVVFTLNGRTASVMLSWTDHTDHKAVVAHAFEIAIDNVAQLFFVPHRPSDLERAGLQCFLMQQTTAPRPSSFLRLILIDIEIFDQQEIQPFALRRYAKWMPMTINRRSVFRMLDLETFYQEREERCHLWHNHQDVGVDLTSPLQLQDGDYLQVHIGDEPPSLTCISDQELASLNSGNASNGSDDTTFEPDTSMFLSINMTKTQQIWQRVQDEFDEALALMQRSTTRWRRNATNQHGSSVQHPSEGCTNFVLNPHAPVFDPTMPNLATAPEHLQELHQYWLRTAFSWEGEEASTTVLTWLVDQYHPGLRTCLQPRPARLYADHRQWTTQLRNVWPDRAISGAPILVHVVIPQPPNLQQDIAAHVILVQNPQDSLSSALFTGFDHSLPQPGPFLQLVTTTHEHFRLDQLLVFLGLGARCVFPGANMLCTAWYDLFQIQMHRPFPLRDGHGIILHLTTRHPRPRGHNGALLLQGRVQLHRTNQTHALQAPFVAACEPPLQLMRARQHSSEFVPGAPPHAQAQTTRQQPQHPDLPPDQWLLPVGMSFLQHAHPVDDEGHAEVEWMTWFLCAHTGRTSDESRRIQFDMEQHMWLQDLHHLWRDRWTPHLGAEIYVIEPMPPKATYETHVGGLLIVQGRVPHHVPVLVTTIFASSMGRRISHKAVFMPQPCPTTLLQQMMRLEQICQDRTCRIEIAGQQIPEQGLAHAAEGDNVRIQVAARTEMGVSFLQTKVTHQINHEPACERQTADTVAHDQRPQDRLNIFPDVGERRPQDWIDPQQRTIVQVVYAFWDDNQIHPPHHLELHSVYSAEDVEQELQSWGFHFKVFLCGEHDIVFAIPHHCITQTFYYVYCAQDHCEKEPVFVRMAEQNLQEQQHMRYLHSKGFHKAVVMQKELWLDNVQCIHFLDVQPENPDASQSSRTRTPWPANQPMRSHINALIDPDDIAQPDQLQDHCNIHFDVAELCAFMDDAEDILWKDYSQFDLPEFIREALDRCQKVERIDRYVIFTDGSSQTTHRHRPPLWIAEHDVGDSWAFAVFAEQYSEHPHEASTLEFLGWTCQQVLYDTASPHSIGTTRTGSDAAETEALFWGGLWRLSRNNNIPTVFMSDSRLIGDQAAGRCGSTIRDLPFYNLRAVFQALEAGLGREGLEIAHVRSHTGDPYNELVDWLAKREPHQSQLLPRQKVNLQTFKTILKHLWIAIARTPDLPDLHREGFRVPPIALPTTQSEVLEDQINVTASIHYTISHGTANVQTFYRGEQGCPGKLQYVREQFRAHGLNFLGIQEARTEPGTSLQDQVYRMASGHDGGHFGVEIWINLGQPYAHQGRQSKHFQRTDFVVVTKSPRHMLVHVVNTDLRFWILCAHAPHSGSPGAEREEWWQDLSDHIQRHVQDEPIIVMIDANARTGPADQLHVFDHDDSANANTVLFRDFLRLHHLCVPSTLPLHEGYHATWIHPSEEAEYRIDYILIPSEWASFCTRSSSLDHLDMGHLGDHRAMAVEQSWQGTSSNHMLSKTMLKSYDRTKILKTDLAASLDAYAPLPWNADIEQQVDHFNQHVIQVLQQHCPVQKQGPKKSYISEQIWTLRTQKLRLQRHAKDNKKRQQQELLTRLFQAWAGRIGHERYAQSIQYGQTIAIRGMHIRIQLCLLARKLKGSLTKAKRMHVKEILNELPSDCAASTILNTLKPVIGPTNPKLKKTSPLPLILNDQGKPCTTPAELTNCWADFFGAMEGGQRVSEHTLRDDWIKDLQQFMQQELSIGPDDIPTLTDLEYAFRRVRPRKAIGDDQVPPELCHRHPTQLARMTFTQMLKLCTHGQESLQHKGGLLVAAWKRKGPQNLCSSYRSLLISSHVGKTVHRAVRDHQATVYEAFLQHQQVGGRRHFPVTMGVHYLRAAARMAKQAKRSHAMIFLDLQEAFYRVLRPLATGGDITDSLLADIAARLRLPADAISDLHQLLQMPAATDLAGLPPHLARALQALHTNTHFRVHGQQDVTHTRVGTRPGDPFADVAFGYMFARLLSAVEQRMQELHIMEIVIDVEAPGLFPDSSSTQMAQYPILGPTWMDDLCISVTSDTASGTERKAGLAAGVLLETCMHHGVTPNLQKGKTEILFSFRGKGSRALRQKYFSPQQGQKMAILTEYGNHYISVVGEYIHLGGITHHSGTTRKEMRRRIAIGNNAFNQHRRLLFQNSALSIEKRTQLFMTLVASKITYGTESWVLDTDSSNTYFHGAIVRLYRRLAKCPPDSAIQDDEIMVQMNLPSPADLLRISRLRYLALLYRCEDVTPWALLRADDQWTQQIRQDLQWLWQLLEKTTTLRNPDEHFPAWEYVLRYHRSYWKTLLQRALQLSQLHRQDDILLRRLHHDVLGHLAQWGPLQFAPIRPHIPTERQNGHYGCMACGIRCRSKAGEGAHLFKVHGICARERHWITHTGCEICLKEYHSFDKLQAHLRRSETCRAQLCLRPLQDKLMPGIGSTDNNKLKTQHDDLLPVQQAAGPRFCPRPPGEIDLHHVPLFEQLILEIMDSPTLTPETLQVRLREAIQAHAISWTHTQLTLKYAQQAIKDLEEYDADTPKETVIATLEHLTDPLAWAFLTEIQYETASTEHLHGLDLYEQWCRDLAGASTSWRPTLPCPRPVFRERVVLHAYSGRRRPGDFQWFLDALGRRQDLAGFYVVSLDIVIDSTWGDISNQKTQRFWLESMRTGYVIGFLSGPPCCTWSIARGKQVANSRRKGPRVLRTAAELWGFRSASLKEKRQIYDGHLLLGFSLHAMVVLSTVQSCGALEHPAEPADEAAASIWRLPIVQMITSLPGFRHYEFAQGLLGADSAKRTGLLTLHLPDLPKHLRANAVCTHIPRAQTIGIDDQGQFRTAKLKEYPPALCKALAEGFFSHFPSHEEVMKAASLPADFVERCKQMTCSAMGTKIGADYAGS